MSAQVFLEFRLLALSKLSLFELLPTIGRFFFFFFFQHQIFTIINKQQMTIKGSLLFFFFCLFILKMTVDLHKWSGEEQLSQLKHYAAKNTPATTTLLSYLVNTKESTIAPLDELSIWTTHPDPLHTNDIVIWMLEWQHRVRLFVNSEIQLESSELTEKAIKYSHGEERKGNNYAYFKDEKDEQLYRRALDKVEQVVTWFIEDTYKNDKGIK